MLKLVPIIAILAIAGLSAFTTWSHGDPAQLLLPITTIAGLAGYHMKNGTTAKKTTPPQPPVPSA